MRLGARVSACYVVPAQNLSDAASFHSLGRWVPLMPGLNTGLELADSVPCKAAGRRVGTSTSPNLFCARGQAASNHRG